MAEKPTNPALNPQALAPTDAVRALSAASGMAVDLDKIEADIADGAPTNADGTLNLVHYAAWLAKEMGNGR